LNKLAAICLIASLGCHDPSPNCFKKSGSIETQVINIEPFQSITLHENISIVLDNGPQKVTLSAGSNLISRINFSVINNRLTIQNDNVCNWTRDYGEITVTISHPSLEEIELLGYGSVSSLDTLSFGQLRIISLDSPSDIYLVVNGTKLSISSNNVSNFHLSGYLEELDVGFYYGDGILYAHDLNTRQINIDHRGTNSLHLHPGESLTGTMQGAGNTIIYYKPLERDVNILGTGKLIERY